MDRYALFVDAGYLFAAAGSLCAGTKRRSALTCDYPQLVAGLRAFAGHHCDMPMLRIYWYDGARDAVPSTQQRQLADLPDLKLRLGRMLAGRPELKRELRAGFWVQLRGGLLVGGGGGCG